MRKHFLDRKQFGREKLFTEVPDFILSASSEIVTMELVLLQCPRKE